MTIIPYDRALHSQLDAMFVEYFNEIGCDIPEQIIRSKILGLFHKLHQAHTIHIAIPIENGIPIGFSIYQIDSPESDWCKRPGWGCIREFFICPAYRRSGCGTALAVFCEKHLHMLGADRFYLTADDANDFWEYCGYSNTHEICSNDLEILTK